MGQVKGSSSSVSTTEVYLRKKKKEKNMKKQEIILLELNRLKASGRRIMSLAELNAVLARLGIVHANMRRDYIFWLKSAEHITLDNQRVVLGEPDSTGPE